MFEAHDLDFHLSGVRYPTEPRPLDEHRLYVYDKATDTSRHAMAQGIGHLLRPGDLMVFNNSRVEPVQFYLDDTRFVLLIQPQLDTLERARVICPFKPAVGETLHLPFATVSLMEHEPGWDVYWARISPSDDSESLATFVRRHGQFPLPIYIQRRPAPGEEDSFQSVYAKIDGSIAPPVAGSHFSMECLEAARAYGIDIAEVTLHVGYGTFRSFKTRMVDDHVMDPESFSISRDVIRQIERTRRTGGRVVAIGTTVARVLETVGADWESAIKSQTDVQGETTLFIKPPYTPRIVGGLVTNFQYPRLPVICMAATFVGLQPLRQLYSAAVERGYLFYSLGDAMLLLF
jgi:S-adenosylmethionine:tRNA ribosyltransferase-isomerase